MILVTIPLRLSNPLNSSHGHWATKARPRKAQRLAAALALRTKVIGVTLPVTVTVTRIAPRKLDAHDGLGAACKGVIDGVADALGVRDDDPRITWRLAQRRGGPWQYAVEIEVSP